MDDTQLARQFAQAALSAPSADNSQPFNFYWDGISLDIKFDSSRVSGKTFAHNDQATLLSAGAAIESVQHFAKGNGYSLEIKESASISTEGHSYASLTSFSNNGAENTASDHEVARHTNRSAFKKKTISENILLAIDKKICGNARLLVQHSKATIKQTAYLIRKASEVRFQTQEAHELLSKNLRFDKFPPSLGDGLHIRTLALPPGGGKALQLISDWRRMQKLNRFGAYKLLSIIDSQPVKNAPALINVIAPATPDAMMDAGKLLNQIWRELNQYGIACHPYYVVADQLARLRECKIPTHLTHHATAISSHCKELYGLHHNETLMMTLRAGYPKKQYIPSARLPVDSLFIDTRQKTLG